MTFPITDGEVSSAIWGWEFAPPREPAPSPLRQSPPEWREPQPPDEEEIHRHVSFAREERSRFVKRGGIVLVLGLILVGPVSGLGLVLLLGGAGLLAYGQIQFSQTTSRAREIRSEYTRGRQNALDGFQAADARWRSQIEAFERKENDRFASEPIWYPLPVDADRGRVDVFGGDSYGWSSLLVTVGHGLLTRGTALVVLDLSDWSVAAELATNAENAGRGVSTVVLPHDLGRVDPLRGLSRDAAVEAMTEAIVTTSDDREDSRGLRAMIAASLRRVVSALDDPISVPRIGAAIRDVIGRYGSDEGLLSMDERDKVQRERDDLLSYERARERLDMMCADLESLASMGLSEVSSPTPMSMPDAGELLILSTSARSRRTKELLDGLMLGSLIQHLYELQGRGRSDTFLFVAGADHLSRHNLEQLESRALEAGIRPIYMFKHLIGAAAEMAGGHATSIYMTLPAREAQQAADNIGRGHKFILSQLTKSIGASSGQSNTTTWGTTDGSSSTISDGGGSTSSSSSTSFSNSWSEAVTHQYSDTWQDAASEQRVYEFVVEPFAFQQLGRTQFIMVTQNHRAIACDCFPGITFAPRVSQLPRGLPSGSTASSIAPSSPPRPDWSTQPLEQSPSTEFPQSNPGGWTAPPGPVGR